MTHGICRKKQLETSVVGELSTHYHYLAAATHNADTPSLLILLECTSPHFASFHLHKKPPKTCATLLYLYLTMSMSKGKKNQTKYKKA